MRTVANLHTRNAEMISRFRCAKRRIDSVLVSAHHLLLTPGPHHSRRRCTMNRLPPYLVLLFLLLIVFVVDSCQCAQAQTFQLIHTFSGAMDGGTPYAGLTIDRAGNLYGTAYQGGDLTCDAPWGCGTIYQLKRSGSNFVFNPLHSFTAGADGRWPASRLIFGPDGALYGTTYEGGTANCGGIGCGTVYKVQPPRHS